MIKNHLKLIWNPHHHLSHTKRTSLESHFLASSLMRATPSISSATWSIMCYPTRKDPSLQAQTDASTTEVHRLRNKSFSTALKTCLNHNSLCRSSNLSWKRSLIVPKYNKYNRLKMRQSVITLPLANASRNSAPFLKGKRTSRYFPVQTRILKMAWRAMKTQHWGKRTTIANICLKTRICPSPRMSGTRSSHLPRRLSSVSTTCRWTQI